MISEGIEHESWGNGSTILVVGRDRSIRRDNGGACASSCRRLGTDEHRLLCGKGSTREITARAAREP